MSFMVSWRFTKRITLAACFSLITLFPIFVCVCVDQGFGCLLSMVVSEDERDYHSSTTVPVFVCMNVS